MIKHIKTLKNRKSEGYFIIYSVKHYYNQCST
jgi:hypothetical protein